ncbi:hypothetical protein THIOM_003533 [Candidatus Thiomargarita nelsonii]|uniref:Uncharacterized protein n=1 Tax=Candidatus Thiomargarita nelsonii TaxID=1003181 RepID=A0A176RYF4_9GAMM|nr:hypothetical protein THIOM_003533 [Candidatus Thiomargarita nelsonii]
MGYLNSRLVTYFVRGILIRTNMITSGYGFRLLIFPVQKKRHWLKSLIRLMNLSNKTVERSSLQLLMRWIKLSLRRAVFLAKQMFLFGGLVRI